MLKLEHPKIIHLRNQRSQKSIRADGVPQVEVTKLLLIGGNQLKRYQKSSVKKLLLKKRQLGEKNLKKRYNLKKSSNGEPLKKNRNQQKIFNGEHHKR